MKKQLNLKNMKDNISNALKLKVNMSKRKMELDKQANVYGFNRELIGTPTSLSMLNSVPLKNADVTKYDQSYNAMKKRRNIPVTFLVQNKDNKDQTIIEEVEENPFSKSKNAEQRLEGIKTHSTPQSRDGHTGIIYKGLLIIFGGDRHHMPFNDTFIFDLATELKQRNLPVPSE